MSKHYPLTDKTDTQYIHIKNDKTPFSVNDEYSEALADNFIDGAAIIVKAPYVVLDFDNKTYFDTVVKILDDYGVKAPIMESDRGGHIWFKSTVQYQNKKHYLPTMMVCDIKAWGKSPDGSDRMQYVIVKRNGKWRKWIQQVAEKDIPDIPYWLTPKPSAWTSMTLEDSFEEGERNDNLYRLQIPLGVHYQFNDQQKKTIIETVNKYCISSPISDKEIDAMFRTGSTYSRGQAQEYKAQFFVDKKFVHYKMGDYLKTNNYVLKYKFTLWCFDNGKYHRGIDKIKMLIRQMIPSLTTSQVKEVINYLTDTLEDKYIRNKPITHIALSNYILDTETLTFHEPTPEIFTPIKLDIIYDPEVELKNREVVEWIREDIIKDILSNDDSQYKLLMEIIGYALVPHTAAQKAFILFGEGSNGKSIITEKLMRPLFGDYSSSLSLGDLNDRFKLGLLEQSLINIDADTSGATLTDTANFKKIATGDEITVDVKYGTPYTVANTAKLVSSFNELPRTKDISPGFNRRILIINFKKKYTHELGNLDPLLDSKINKNIEVIKRWLLFEAINGLQRLSLNKWIFTEGEENAIIKKSFQNISDNVKAWIEDAEINEDKLVNKKISDIFIQYENWCTDDGRWAIPKNQFSKRIREKFGLDSKNRSIDGLTHKIFTKEM